MKDKSKKNYLIREMLDSANFKFTERVLSDLKQAFSQDFSILQACHYAGIRTDTYYRWLKISDEFAKEMSMAQSVPFRTAKKILMKAIQDGDKDMALKFLERREKKRWSLRSELTGADGKDLLKPLSDETKKKLDALLNS